jgi:hypothetical protein
VNFHDIVRSGTGVHIEGLALWGAHHVAVRNCKFDNIGVMGLNISEGFYEANAAHDITIENTVFGEIEGDYSMQIGSKLPLENILIRNNSVRQGFLIDAAMNNVNFHVVGNLGPRNPWHCPDNVEFSHNVWTNAQCGPSDVQVCPGGDCDSSVLGFADLDAMDFHLLPGSPGIDAGDPGDYPSKDMYGTARPTGAGPDAGAVESF